jgi:hypothetical protein
MKELIREYLFIGSFVVILISILGMIWMDLGYSNFLFPKLLATSIIILFLSKAD